MSIKKLFLLLILFVSLFLRLYNIYTQPPRLFIEVAWIWAINLNFHHSLFSITWSELPLYKMILFFTNWIFFIFGYFCGFFKSIIEFDSMRLTNIWLFLFIGRLVNAIFGTATIYIIYVIGKKIKNEKTGLIGALFLAFMYLHVEESRYITYVVPITFFMMLVFLFFLYILSTGKLEYYILSGFFIGLGGAIKYTSFVGIIPFIFSHIIRFVRWREVFNRENIKKISLGICFIIIGFICGYPTVIAEFSALIRSIKRYLFLLFVGWPPEILPKHSCWIDFLPIIYHGAGINFLIPFFLGLLYCLFRKQKEDMLLLFYVIFFYICLGSLHNLTTYYVLPLFPFIALVGAYFIENITSHLHPKPVRNIILAILLLGLVLPSGIKIFKAGFFTYRLEEKDKIMRNFVFNHTPINVKLLDSNQHLSDNTPILDKVGEAYYKR